MWKTANEAVHEAVDNSCLYEWDLNMEASFSFDEYGGNEISDLHRETVPVQGEIIDVHGIRECEGQGEVEGDEMDNEYIELSPPAVGDRFDSFEEAFQYYRLYGKKCGFGVCKRSIHRKGDHIVHYCFSCSKFKPVFIKIDGEPFAEKKRETR